MPGIFMLIFKPKKVTSFNKKKKLLLEIHTLKEFPNERSIMYYSFRALQIQYPLLTISLFQR